MKYFFFILCCLGFVGCQATSTIKSIKGGSFNARITLYSRYEDKFGSKIACSKKLRAKQGITIAAHPDFPFWTKVFIPALKNIIGNGHFIVQDRGTAITSKEASHGKEYVFDVYMASNNKTMRKLASILPPYMPVFLEN